MPRVTVVSIPQEMLQTPKLPASKPKIRKIAWKAAFSKLGTAVKSLICGNLPLNILAFLLGRIAIMGEMAPFGLAIFTAVAQKDTRRAPSVGLWALAGVLSAGQYQEAGIYIFSMLLYFKMADKLTHIHRKLLAGPLLVACGAAVGGVVMNLFTQVALYSVVLALFDAALCLVLTYIFLYGVPILLKNPELSHRATNDSLVCLVTMLAMAVAGFGSAEVADYSLRNIAGSMLIMALALSGGAGLGASAGVAVGLVIGLTDNNVTGAISLYALSGLIAGVFKRMGRFAVMLGFLLGGMLSIMYLGHAKDLMLVLTEVGVSAAAFLLVPGRKISAWQQSLREHDEFDVPPAPAILNEAKAKINNIAAMFESLADAFGTIAATGKEKTREDELNRALALIGERVCGPCTNRAECWETNFYRTYQGMLDSVARGEREQLKPAVLPVAIKDTCIKKNELVDVINLVVERNQSLSFWQRKLTDHRQMVTEQMRAAGAIISNLACEISKEPRSDRDMAAELKSKAAILDCPLEGVRITGTRGAGKIEACKKPCSGTRECRNTILPLAAKLMQEKLNLHAECGSKGKNTKCKLTMEVASRLRVTTGMASAAKDPQGVCGDTCAVVPLNKGKLALMLSDGMGSGSKAAGESNMAVNFLEKLLAVGFDVDVAVKTVNSLLLLRTPEESFATVDMAVIDIYSGETEFLKVGSAPSFVKRVREVSTINSSSLPIGIIHQIEIEPIKSAVVAGDIVVMVSDGVVDVISDSPRRGFERENWVANFLRRIDGGQPQEIADTILQKAIELSGGRQRDDMTVLVAKVLQQS